jgi:hypothetical protein
MLNEMVKNSCRSSFNEHDMFTIGLDWINVTLSIEVRRETVGVGSVIREEKIAFLLIEEEMSLDFIVK